MVFSRLEIGIYNLAETADISMFAQLILTFRRGRVAYNSIFWKDLN